MTSHVLPYYTVFLLGVFHALEPNFNNTLLASHAIGNNTQRRNVIVMLLTMILSQLVFLSSLSLAFHYSASFLKNIETIAIFFQYSPLLLVGIGIYIILTHKKHHHNHQDFPDNQSLKKSISLGILSGLIPCPTIFAPLFMNSGETSVFSSIKVVFSFVGGFSITITVVLFLLFFFKNHFQRYFGKKKLALDFHVLSAYFLIILGLVMTFYSTHFHGSHAL